jgi:Tol biopolymer transport system component
MFVLPLNPRESPRPLLHSPQSVSQLQLSPDRLALAFHGIESNRRSLYVTSLAGADPPLLAAHAVQGAPRWSRDGRHVYFVGGDDYMMSVPVRTSPNVEVGAVRQLFKMRKGATLLDVSRHGRFLIQVPHVVAAELPIVVDTGAVKPKRE